MIWVCRCVITRKAIAYWDFMPLAWIFHSLPIRKAPEGAKD
ncbi:hypothetical protein 18India_57 [Salmonella phage 18-India]|nr:hypothetical protein 18India_57 [Salmonella phage 18-India]